jgi:hypothetical protein
MSADEMTSDSTSHFLIFFFKMFFTAAIIEPNLVKSNVKKS